jgi:hypothetical protein
MMPSCPLSLFVLAAYRAGVLMGSQLERPDMTQSWIWLADLSSRASQSPTASSTTAKINPATAPRRFPSGSGSLSGVGLAMSQPRHGSEIADAAGFPAFLFHGKTTVLA